MLRLEVTGDIYCSPNVYIAIPGDVVIDSEGNIVIEGDVLVADSPGALSELAETGDSY